MARVGSKLFVFDAISIKHIHVLDTGWFIISLSQTGPELMIMYAPLGAGISSTATPLPSDDAQYSYNSPDNWVRCHVTLSSSL
jgi:hypothetical protein